MFLLIVSAMTLSHAQTVTVYQTNPDGIAPLSQQPSVSFGSGSGSAGTTLTLDPTTRFQQMDGFGAAMTDSSAYLINSLPTAQRSALLQWFFSSSSGIGLNFLRQPMGATDLSAQGDFSYDDQPAGSTDVPLSDFSIAKDLTYTIPTLQQAFAINPKIKVEMLPWSPPGWMKLSGTMNGGNFNDIYMPSLANYFVKAIEAYKQEGIPVYAVAAQNEPENNDTNYPTEAFSFTEEGNFIGNYLGPTLATAGLSPNILGYEHNWNDTNYPTAVLEDTAAYPYVAGTSWHCYQGSVTGQSVVAATYPNKGTWFTECSGLIDGTFSNDFQFGMENLIIGATRNNAKAVLEWNLALDAAAGPQNGGCADCRGFVTINTIGIPAVISYNVENYIYGHASKFVVPGAYRIQSNSAAIGAGGIEDVAFQNPDGTIVLIVFNDGSLESLPATFDVAWGPNNSSFSYSLPSGAAATFIWTPSTSTGPGAPTNLVATAAACNQINLSWTASNTPGVTYSVYRSTANPFTPSPSNLVASGLTSLSWANTGLNWGTTYYYAVEAVSSAGTSFASNLASAVTAGSIAAAPSGLSATAASNSQIDLSWNPSPSTQALTYNVYRSTTSGFTPGPENLVAGTGTMTSYADTGLNATTTYYYLVTAVTSAGNSPASNAASATTIPLPTPPTALTAVAASSSQTNLNWTASGTANVTYSVYRSANSLFTPAQSNRVASGLTGTTYADSKLNPAMTWFYVVEAVSTVGPSPASNEASATTPAATNSISTTRSYQIVNEASGGCIDDTSGSTANQTVLQQYACTAGDTNQQWVFTATTGPYYEIATTNASTLAWNVVNNGTAPETAMQLYTYGGGANEQFEPVLLPSGYYEFVDMNSGLCVAVPIGTTTNNVQLQINPCSGSASESFSLN